MYTDKNLFIFSLNLRYPLTLFFNIQNWQKLYWNIFILLWHVFNRSSSGKTSKAVFQKFAGYVNKNITVLQCSLRSPDFASTCTFLSKIETIFKGTIFRCRNILNNVTKQNLQNRVSTTEVDFPNFIAHVIESWKICSSLSNKVSSAKQLSIGEQVICENPAEINRINQADRRRFIWPSWVYFSRALSRSRSFCPRSIIDKRSGPGRVVPRPARCPDVVAIKTLCELL